MLLIKCYITKYQVKSIFSRHDSSLFKVDSKLLKMVLFNEARPRGINKFLGKKKSLVLAGFEDLKNHFEVYKT